MSYDRCLSDPREDGRSVPLLSSHLSESVWDYFPELSRVDPQGREWGLEGGASRAQTLGLPDTR